jgi:DNA-binding XRE family transcriptional regulator
MKSNNLRVRRAIANKTQQQVADSVGCARQTVANIESGKYEPNTALALRIAKFLKCSLTDIFKID